MEGTVDKRVFLGGLVDSVTEADLIDRFKSFGSISKLSLADPSSDQTAAVLGRRGFAHFNLTTTEANWRKLLTAYNGASWRGSKMCLGEAKPDYLTRLNQEWQAASTPPTVRHRPFIRHHGDMTLMTDSKIGKGKPGWKKGRYGRAVAMIKMRRPDGKLITVDPAHYRDRFEKLFGSVKPLPINRLAWSITDTSAPRVGCSDSSSSSSSELDATSQAEEVELGGMRIDRFAHASPVSNSEVVPETLIHEAIDETLTQIALPEELARPCEMIQPKSEGFFLSRLLGLESVTDLSSLPVSHSPPTKDSSQPEPKMMALSLPSVKDLLFDFSTIHSLPLNDYAFCRRSGIEEFTTLWKEARMDLRTDFKKRLKQARKMANRRPARSSFSRA